MMSIFPDCRVLVLVEIATSALHSILPGLDAGRSGIKSSRDMPVYQYVPCRHIYMMIMQAALIRSCSLNAVSALLVKTDAQRLAHLSAVPVQLHLSQPIPFFFSSKQPNINKQTPQKHKKSHPHPPSHPRPLRHPQHPIHRPS